MHYPPHNVELSLTERLKFLRKQVLGLNRTDAAKRLCVDEKTLGNYERGERLPQFEVLVRLNNITGVDLNWLILGTKPLAGTLDPDVLHAAVQAVEEEVPDIDAASKAKLVLRLYRDRTQRNAETQTEPQLETKKQA